MPYIGLPPHTITPVVQNHSSAINTFPQNSNILPSAIGLPVVSPPAIPMPVNISSSETVEYLNPENNYVEPSVTLYPSHLPEQVLDNNYVEPPVTLYPSQLSEQVCRCFYFCVNWMCSSLTNFTFY